MGFSVSSGAAIVFIGLFVTVGAVFTAMTNSTERVTDAQRSASDESLEQKNSAVEITSASFSSGTLTVEANNTGAAAITLSETELLVDNEHVPQSSFSVLTVDGQSDTDLWLPGETLRIEVDRSQTPTRVKVVAAHGVADSEVV